MNNAFSYHDSSEARLLFDYLCLRDEPSVADAVMGFGHFDEKIPIHCGKLFSEGFAGLIIFSGGVGAGSTGLIKPESLHFLDILFSVYPKISHDKIITEDRSTNTSENILFTLSKLNITLPDYTPGKRLKKLLIVANAYRQRRVWLSCRKHLPEVKLINNPPLTSFETEIEMFKRKGEDLVLLMLKELERIGSYPRKGYIEFSDIPEKIILIAKQLKLKIN